MMACAAFTGVSLTGSYTAGATNATPTASFSFKWYVFNLADVAIVAGVIGLLYETLVGADAAKAP